MSNTNLKPAVAIQDDAGHWYVIPAEMENDFYDELTKTEWLGINQFKKKYGKYATGGSPNSVQLYAIFPN